MTLRNTITLTILAASLAACGKGISVGTESTAGSETAEQSSQERTRSMSDSKTAKASSAAPGAQLVGMASQPVLAFFDIDLDRYARGVKYDDKSILPVDEQLKLLKTAGKLDPAKVSALNTRVLAAYGKDPVLDAMLKPLKVCIDEASEPCFSDFFTRLYAVAAVQAVTVPQVKPAFDSGEIYDKLNNERSFNQRELDRWIAGSSAILELSIKLQPTWLESVQNAVMRSQQDALSRIVAKMFATDVAQIKEFSKRPAGLSARISPDETGKPIRLVVVEKSWNLSQDEKGLTITKNGSIWHGDGQIAGGKLEVALETSATNSQDQRATYSSTSNERQGTSTKAGVDLRGE